MRNEEHGVGLKLPGEGWSLLTAKEVDAYGGGVRVGAQHAASRMTGLVYAEPRGGELDLEAAARELLGHVKPADVQFEPAASVQYLGLTAVELKALGKVDGSEVRWATRSFRRGEELVRILVAGPASRFEAQLVSAFFDAVELSEAKRSTKPRTFKLRDAVGPGFRVREGVYQSAASGIEFRAFPEVEVFVGDQCATQGIDAEVAIGDAESTLRMEFKSEPAPGGRATLERLRAEHDQRMAASSAVSLAADRTWSPAIGGDRVAFRGYALGSPGAGNEVQVAFVERLGRSVRIVVSYVAARRELALQRAAAVLEKLRFLTKEAKVALAKELESQRDPLTTVGKSYSVRGGTFRHFSFDVAWTRPDATWAFLPPEWVRTHGPPNALFMAESVELGLVILAYAQSVATSTTDAEFARGFAQVASASGATSSALALSFGGVAVRGLDEVAPHSSPSRSAPTAGLPTAGLERHLSGTAVRGETGFVVSVSASNEVLQAHRPQAIAAVRGFRLGGAGPVREDRGGTYFDYRWGYAFTAPPGWKRTYPVWSEQIGTAEQVRWDHQDGALELVLGDVPSLLRGEELLDLQLEHLAKDFLKNPAQRVDKRRATLGDLITYEVTLDRRPALLGARGRVTFSWFAEGENVDPFARVKAGFRTLD